MLGGVPRGPNDGQQLVTNAQADHLVAMKLVDKDAVEDAPGHDSPLDRVDDDDASGTADEKAVAKAVKAELKRLRAEDADKLKLALADQERKGNDALDAELKRIREDGEAALAERLEEQVAEQDQAFEAKVAEAVAAKLAEDGK
jgi:hypothetical protein